MGLRKVFTHSLAIIAMFYYTQKGLSTEYRPGKPPSGLEQAVKGAASPVATYAPAPRQGADENVQYLDDVIRSSKESGLYQRFEEFMERKRGKAPRERYWEVGRPGLDDAVVAYTDLVDTIGLGGKFKEQSMELADRYGISPTLAGFLTYAHERAHLSKGRGASTKEDELAADGDVAEFLEHERERAYDLNDRLQARQYERAREYQLARLDAVRQDRIASYRDAA